MQYVAIACRALLGVVFLLAVVSKLSGRRAFAEFVQSFRAMRVVPEAAVTPLAWLTVAGEATAAVLLAVPVRAAGLAGFSLAAILLAAFGGAIVISLRHGNSQPCRCFGRSATPLGRLHVWRNVLLVFAALIGTIATTIPADSPVTVAPALVAVFAGLVLGAVVVALDDIAYLFAKPTVTR